MERNSLSSLSPDMSEHCFNLLQKSQKLNDSLDLCTPMLTSYILGFDEAVYNMKLCARLLVLADHRELPDFSYRDLFVFCHQHKIIKGRLSDWLYYQALRKKITPAIDKATVAEVVKVAPKFLSEIDLMIQSMEKLLQKYRRLN